jgi:hypothetical protein
MAAFLEKEKDTLLGFTKKISVNLQLILNNFSNTVLAAYFSRNNRGSKATSL